MTVLGISGIVAKRAMRFEHGSDVSRKLCGFIRRGTLSEELNREEDYGDKLLYDSHWSSQPVGWAFRSLVYGGR